MCNDDLMSDVIDDLLDGISVQKICSSRKVSPETLIRWRIDPMFLVYVGIAQIARRSQTPESHTTKNKILGSSVKNDINIT